MRVRLFLCCYSATRAILLLACLSRPIVPCGPLTVLLTLPLLISIYVFVSTSTGIWARLCNHYFEFCCGTVTSSPTPPNDNFTISCPPNCSRVVPRFLLPYPHPPFLALSLGHNLTFAGVSRWHRTCRSDADPRRACYSRPCPCSPMCGEGPHTGGGVRRALRYVRAREAVGFD